MSFILSRTKDHVVVSSEKSSIVFDRKTGSLSTKQETEQKGQVVFGVLGTINLVYGKYLIVIKQREKIGNLAGNDIYRICDVEITPILLVNESSQYNDSRYLELLRSTFASSQAFYYSPTLDLTTNLQTSFRSKTSEPDELFFWNNYISTELRKSAPEWIIPTIRGFIELHNVKLEGRDEFQFGILSRLGCKRVGTRYNMRGADSLGHVANYVETEQVVVYKDKLQSFLQVRGSIPLLWTQLTNLKYKPALKISESWDPFNVHFKNQLARYQKIMVVNLINQTGSENVIGMAYESHVKKLNNADVTFLSFDFHNKTKLTNFNGINELVSSVKPNLDQEGFLETNWREKKVVKDQTGVLRVNCIDCLDRTNVCESVFGRIVLNRQLHSLGILKENETVENVAALEKLFKYVWADNGDMLSNLYAGTNAIKADFTRTGKRTLMGLYNDAKNSIVRYYLNNFTDGKKQDGMNLLLGRVVLGKFDERGKTISTVYSVLQYALFTGLLVVFTKK